MAEVGKQQVSLRGASVKEISRDALLEKVSKERQVRNYARRASVSALFIQRVWRSYYVRKKVAMDVQEEWELLVHNKKFSITRTWVSSSLLRPFLFFITCPSIAHQKKQTTNIRCMLTCFKVLLQSMNFTEPQKNFCCLAMASVEERGIWLYQAKKLVSVCLSILAEFSSTSLGSQDTTALTSLAMRMVLALTDRKLWKCVTNENFRDADNAVKDLILSSATGKLCLYSCIRNYILNLKFYITPQRNCSLETDDQLLITASAVTIALRPFQIAELDVKGAVSMEIDVVEQYSVYLLTVPWLVQRLPRVLLPALKHNSVLTPCLRTLLIAKDKIFLEMSKLDQLQTTDCFPKRIPCVGWALANIINLASEYENDSLNAGKFSQGLNCAAYVHAVTMLAEKLLTWLERLGRARKNHDAVDNVNASTDITDPEFLEGEISIGSLKLLYRDLFRPVFQQWHLMMLLAISKKDSSIQIATGNSPNSSLEALGKLKLLDIAYLYSYTLRILAFLNPNTGSLPILNVLSFTPGFLPDLWGALEGSIFFGGGQAMNDKPSTSGLSIGETDGNFEKSKKRISKDMGNKWVNVLQKVSRKPPTNEECGDSPDIPPGLSEENEYSYDIWDVEPFKQGLQGISKDVACMLHLFCSTYAHLLLVLDDIEFYEKQVPFTLGQQRRITSVLNTLVYNEFSHSSNEKNLPLMDASVRCLHLLYERDCRRQFCPPHLWLSPARKSRPPIAAAARAHEAVSVNPSAGYDLSNPTMGSVISVTPHVFPFEERAGNRSGLGGREPEYSTAHTNLNQLRVQMFREFIKLDKVSRKMAGEVAGPGPGSVEIVIRRSHIVEDGFKQLNSLGSRLKSNIHVSFVSECGLPEAGLDYGGLSKEFLTDITRTAFDPDYGLFAQSSTSERHLVPNISARSVDNGMQMIEFLGRIVGKALYEGILLDYSFSHVFVQKLLGRYSFLDELSTLDPELYRNLMYVKNYNGEVMELSLDFTVTDEYYGKHVVTELIPGGKDVAVTNENKLQYIHAIADYKLNRQILPLAKSFFTGLIDLISPSWLSLFNAGEFNQLLSGGDHDIDVDDLRNNTRYTGGYSGGSRTIRIFWEVLVGFEPNQRCMLLKFVTSCSRAPLLGFKHLHPSFTIHKVACAVPVWAAIGGQDVDRLPSASTCYNTLKLPTYKRASTLRTKLLYAISSNAGFELS
ncbi:hypothetical protein IFM89_006065 [Coptis chinensis]|uniref:HECT-type E3 ubiquitin transferase n=1 Tax=Coptis chinensis TaxID=261450 RepID=A0A835H2C5_9MAGN|nr:hypothetical protein IFM89_006065 [Coptis chinensis]